MGKVLLAFQVGTLTAEQGAVHHVLQALFQHLERFVHHARKAARDLYGCRGVYFPIQTDAWGRATPESFGWAEALERRGLVLEPDATRADLVRTMASLYRRGVEVAYDFYVYPDLRNSAQYAVYFGQSGITMPDRDYYHELDNANFAQARDQLPGYIARMLMRGCTGEAAAVGSVKVTVVPLPTSLEMSIVPPCRSTMP